jgi:hypothetical protein
VEEKRLNSGHSLGSGVQNGKLWLFLVFK